MVTAPHAAKQGGSLAVAPVASAIVAALEESKAVDIVQYDVTKLSSGLFDLMIICTANSERHGSALATNAISAAKAAGMKVGKAEGGVKSDWRLLDMGSVIVHIMSAQARSYYDLEGLWSAAE